MITFLFGYFFEILRRPFMAPHKEWIKQLSNDRKDNSVPPLISYSYLLGRYSILVLDCDIVQEILMENAAREPLRFPKRYGFLQQIAGSGLATLEGEQWSRHRRIFQPCFQPSFLREQLQAVVPPLVDRFILAWEMAAKQDKVIDVATHMAALTLDILGQASFAHDFQGVTTVEEWAFETRDDNSIDDDDLGEIPDPLIQALTASFKINPLQIFLELLGLASWINVLDVKARKSRQMLDQAAQNILDNARKNLSGSKEGATACSGKRTSLLERMLWASNRDKDASNVPARNQLSENELREEIASFVVAGHETTSSWCMWAIYALALYPDLQEKVYEDVRNNLVSGGSTDSIQLDDVRKMEYFQAFLNEVLRLYSPVGMIFRFTSRDECWHGYDIPPNTRLVIPIHLLHRHADHWARPDELDPERWLIKSASASAGRQRHRCSFLPFSEGPRNCIGYRFAEDEAKLILSNLILKFRFSLDKSTQESGTSFTIFIAMKSKPPVKIKLDLR
ncbi:MAG: hypothetical protein SGILL_008344 [Bacillariaceae sp.]